MQKLTKLIYKAYIVLLDKEYKDETIFIIM